MYQDFEYGRGHLASRAPSAPAFGTPEHRQVNDDLTNAILPEDPYDASSAGGRNLPQRSITARSIQLVAPKQTPDGCQPSSLGGTGVRPNRGHRTALPQQTWVKENGEWRLIESAEGA
jgi:hypothetical protein